MSKMDILIVEDEIVVAMDIKVMVEDMGFCVVGIATNYDETQIMLKEKRPNIILMDINLDDSEYDGIEIASKIDIPVLYLTAFSDDETINRAIKTNPLGYIVKPFKEAELKANIQLAIYKLNMGKPKIVNSKMELGYDYFYDEDLEKLFFNEMIINLGKYEKKLFKLLLDARGSVVSFANIDYEIWGDNIVNESTRRSLIFRLKSKLEHKFLETVSGVGCRIVIG